MRRSAIGIGLALILCLGLLALWAVLIERAPENEPPAGPINIVESAEDEKPTLAVPVHAPETTATPTTALTTAGTLRGRVLDALSGEPVAQFQVQFRDPRAVPSSGASGTREFQSEDGRFEWPGVVPGTWMITARSRGYQPFDAWDLQIPESGATSEIVLRLRRGHSLRGRVYDEATGSGIPSASVSFREAHLGRYEGRFRDRPIVQTGKDGQFVMEGVPAGRLTLMVHATGYTGEERGVTAESSSSVEIGLATGGTIAGRVTAADGVTPLAASLSLTDVDMRSGTVSRTAKDGTFRYPHLGEGRYRISAEAQGGRTDEMEIVLGRNQHVENVVLPLAGGRSIRGLVSGLTPRDFPLVRINLHRQDRHENGVNLNSQGEYVLHGVQPGPIQLVAEHVSGRRISKSLEMPGSADATVSFEFPKGARLFGRVTRAGQPVQYMGVSATAAANPQVRAFGESSSSGHYVIEGLSTGEYLVGAYGRGKESLYISGDTEFNVDIPGAHLSGRVLEVNGKVPVVGVAVRIRAAPASSSRVQVDDQTDHFGAFSLIGLEAGDFELTAYKPGYEMLREPITFAASVEDMTLRLKRDAGVEVRAREAASGKALRSVWVSQMIGNDYGIQVSVRLDENGLGSVPASLAGNKLAFSSDGYAQIFIAAWDGQPLDLQFAQARE